MVSFWCFKNHSLTLICNSFEQPLTTWKTSRYNTEIRFQHIYLSSRYSISCMLSRACSVPQAQTSVSLNGKLQKLFSVLVVTSTETVPYRNRFSSWLIGLLIPPGKTPLNCHPKADRVIGYIQHAILCQSKPEGGRSMQLRIKLCRTA